MLYYIRSTEFLQDLGSLDLKYESTVYGQASLVGNQLS